MTEIEWLEAFFDNLRDCMELRGYGVRELSEASGISRQNIYRYINKTQAPSAITIVKLAYALDVDYEDLMGFPEEIEKD